VRRSYSPPAKRAIYGVLHPVATHGSHAYAVNARHE
jgi:hypothetical protein